MKDEENLKPFFKRYPFLVKPLALVLLIFAPVILPVLLIIEHWDGDVAEYFDECLSALRLGKK